MEKTGHTRDYLRIVEEYHQKLDAAVRDTLAMMKGMGKLPPCGPGCAWCCRLPLSATVPEAMLAARYISERLAGEETVKLIKKMKAWLSWKETELPRLADRGFGVGDAHMLHGPDCPMLTGGLCAIYPVRPLGCRVHFSYNEKLCRPPAKPGALFDGLAEVAEILEAVRPLCMEYRRELESRGLAFDSIIDTLPQLVLRELE